MRAKCLTHRRSPCVLLTQGQKVFVGRFGPTAGGYQRAGWITGPSATRTGSPDTGAGELLLGAGLGRCSEGLWQVTAGSRNLCLSEPLVPESIGNPRLISLVNHTCYLHRPGPRALTFGGIFGRKPTDRNSTADVRYVGGWFSFWQK